LGAKITDRIFILGMFLIILQLILPFSLYVVYVSNVEKIKLKVIIDRSYNSEEAKEALLFVEGNNLNTYLASNISSYGIIFNNNTLEEYLDLGKESDPEETCTITYRANSTEANISIKILVLGNISFVSIWLDNWLALNDSYAVNWTIEEYLYDVSLVNYTGKLERLKYNATLETVGFFIDMRLSYFSSYLYGSQSSHNEERHQILVLDKQYNIIFIASSFIKMYVYVK